MAAERVLNGLNELIREAVLAAMREELAAHKEEVNELRHTSSVVNERNKAADAVIHERERGLAPVKGELAEQRDVAERRELDMREMREELLAELVAVKWELAAVKGEVGEVKGGLSEVKGGLAEMRGGLAEMKGGLAEMKGGLCEHKQSTALQLEEAERRRMAEIKEIRGQVEERERELAVVKRELAALKDAMIEQLGIAERSRESELRVLLEEVTKKADEMKAELAREREQAVEEFIGPRAMEELSYCRRWQHVDLEISQSEGDRRDACEQIKEASRRNHLSLAALHDLSDDILSHVSTMANLNCIDMNHTSGFSADGIKQLFRLPRLETLNLGWTDVSDSALEGIGSLTSLRSLLLHHTNVTDAGLAHLTRLSSLKVLWLQDCKGVTDAGMVHVRRLGLEMLEVGGSAVTAGRTWHR